ncbi:MAG: hypothetical protein KF850_11765 [Labilithrix sp.]|nr:hypothetical protein [Labilithrix sp.]
MPRNVATALVVLVVGVLGAAVTTGAAGCGSDAGGPDLEAGGGAEDGPETPGSSGGASTNPAVPRDRFLPELIDAICSTLEPCCRAGGYDYVASACADALSGGDAGGVRLAFDRRVIEDPANTYDPQAAGDCIAYFRAFNEVCTQPSTAGRFALAQAISGGANAALAAGCFRMLSGTKKPGEPCDSEGFFSGCALTAQGYALCLAPRGADGGASEPATCRTSETVPLGASCDPDSSTVRGTVIRQCNPQIAPLDSYADQDALYRDLVLCDPASRTCKKGSELYPAAGQPCAGERNCAPSAFCGPDDVCAPRAGAGQSCATIPCSRATDCQDGTCVAGKPDGEPCTSNRECLGDCNAKNVCAPFDGIANRALCTGQ